MESEIEHKLPLNPEKNKLDEMGKIAVEERETIEQNRPDISQLILRDGKSFTNPQTGDTIPYLGRSDSSVTFNYFFLLHY